MNMMKKFLFVSRVLVVIYATIMSCFAYAALELELTQGISSALPIAITQFSSSSASSQSSALCDVIRNDLKNSGRFRLVELSGFFGLGGSKDKLDYESWRSQRADNVVTGSIEPVSNSQYKISFELHDVYGKTVLLSQQYTVSQAQLRKIAHHISDIIYQKLTGIRGVFSTKIAYILVNRGQGKTRYVLEISDADGFNPKTLLSSNQPIMSPAWSPDGKHIAYVSFEGKRSSIYTQELSTGKRKLISKFPGINGAPAWSYDGRKMALVLTRTGDPKIYLLDLATKSLRQLTFGRALDTEPNFSPDGMSLVFTSNRSGSPQIYKLDLATGEVSRLTYNGNYNARGSFSPDGKSLIMLHQDEGMFNVATQDIESGRVTTLTRTGFDESPSVAPNGSMIVYATTYNRNGILAEVSSDGRIKLNLPAHGGEVQEPAWSPFLN